MARVVDDRALVGLYDRALHLATAHNHETPQLARGNRYHVGLEFLPTGSEVR
jgi:hypothetical protein